MSGHNKWAQIKHQKGATDKKRAVIFSKLLRAITIAAREEPNTQFNPRLRAAVQKARDNQVPADNIDRAIRRASEVGEQSEEILYEAYGPGGVAILIQTITDNRNRTVQEIKKVVGDHEGKWAEIGSVRWAFDASPIEHGEWQAKFPQALDERNAATLRALVEALDDHADVQKVFTSARI